jgi:hypothetical protein
MKVIGDPQFTKNNQDIMALPLIFPHPQSLISFIPGELAVTYSTHRVMLLPA